MKLHLLYGALVGALATAGIAAGQGPDQTFNGGFENGFTSNTQNGIYGTPALILSDFNAEGRSHQVPGVLIDQYTTSNNQWVSSNGGGALGSNHFLYISNAMTCIEFRNDLQLSGMRAGQQYQVCFYAATAAAQGNALLFGGLTSYTGGWHRIPDANGNLFYTGTPGGVPTGLLTLPSNAAWKDGQATTIPWQKYCYTFTAPTTVDGVTYTNGALLPGAVGFDISSGDAFGVNSTAFVLDGVTLAPVVGVPEPATLGLMGLAGGAWAMMRMRRRAA